MKRSDTLQCTYLIMLHHHDPHYLLVFLYNREVIGSSQITELYMVSLSITQPYNITSDLRQQRCDYCISTVAPGYEDKSTQNGICSRTPAPLRSHLFQFRAVSRPNNQSYDLEDSLLFQRQTHNMFTIDLCYDTRKILQ